jgi:RHS repeat-associated protein
MQNPRTFTTTYSYTCSNAFLYQVTNAKSQQTTYNYADCNLGKPTSVVDANGTTTSIQYNDPLDRPTHGTLPDGANVDYQYSTDLKTLTVVKDLDAGRRTTTSNTTDGFGRTIQTVDAANVTTLRGLDALGRLHIAYNPGSTTNGTTYTYDALNRTATITYADGSPESFQWTGDFMVHTDPSPTSTQQQVDALGRLLQVVEDNGGANLTTTYTYDALDNLIGVNQPGLTSACTSGQSRCFVYDSLKELTSANSPESGVTNYAYDPNGNLAQRVQGGVTTSFQYDPLDRLAFKTYTGVSTPAVTNCYDGYGSVAGTPDGTCVAGSVPNSTGRLTETRNSVSKTSYTAYDPLGRVLGSVQTTGNQPYTFSYTYNLAGVLTRTTFPSGRSVMNYYDTAGRVCSVSGTQVNPPSLPTSCTVAGTTQVTAYANSVSYTPQGSLQSIARGDQLTETWGYNNRLQATSVNVGTAGSAFGMNLYYCPLHAASCATDNGNVLGLWLVTPGVYEDFTYSDRLNRLTSIQEGSSTQSYGYDSRGNRWLAQNTGTVPLPASSFLATSAADYNSQNQLTRQGAQYADRGNQTAIGLYTFTYDGESRMQTSQLNSGTTTYSYDADGRRVMKQSPTGTTTYVYDAFGDVAAEYGAASTGPCITCYVSVDHLLSTRALTDSSGNVVERHDYMPFGDELFAGTGGRTAAQQYLASPTAETLNTLFSGKYRDPELVSSAMASGLDYFGARYFSAAQGRFTSPDSPSFSKLSYPQTWNLYAYAVNNPLSYIDPTGHEIVCANNAEQCQNDAAAATGNAAAAQRVTTQTTTTQHSFLGLFHWTTSKTTIAISGDINSFRALSQNASRLADLVAGKTTVTVTYDQYARPSMWANGIQLKGGSTSYVPTQGYEAQAFIDPGRYGATYDTDAIAQGIPQSNTAEEFAHEVLGHIWGDVIGLHFALKTGTRANMRDSIQAEDVVRALDPTRGQKALESHHNYQDMPPDPRTGCLPCHQ